MADVKPPQEEGERSRWSAPIASLERVDYLLRMMSAEATEAQRGGRARDLLGWMVRERELYKEIYPLLGSGERETTERTLEAAGKLYMALVGARNRAPDATPLLLVLNRIDVRLRDMAYRHRLTYPPAREEEEEVDRGANGAPEVWE